MAEHAAKVAEHAHTQQPPVLDKTYKHLTEAQVTSIKALYETKTDLENQLTALQNKNSQWAISTKGTAKGQNYNKRLKLNIQNENAIGARMNKNNADIKVLEDLETVSSTAGRRPRERGTEPFETLSINADGDFTPYNKDSTLYTALSQADKTAYDKAFKQSEVSQLAFKGVQEQTATRLASVADNTERKKIIDAAEIQLKGFQAKYNEANKIVTEIREKEVTITIPTAKKLISPTTGPFKDLSVSGDAGEFKGIDKNSEAYKALLPEQKEKYLDAVKNAKKEESAFVTKTNSATTAYNKKVKPKTRNDYEKKINGELDTIRFRYNDAVKKAADALGPYGKRIRLRGGN